MTSVYWNVAKRDDLNQKEKIVSRSFYGFLFRKYY